MSESPKPRLWLAPIIGFLFSGCMALPFLIPPLVEFGANLLRTAVNNYGDAHERNMENLLMSLRQTTNPNVQQGIYTNPYGANPYGQTGVYQQPGYSSQDYQTAQGYPSSQGYPYSQDYSQPGYDPYQAQAPQYGTPQGYPSSPDYSQQAYDPYQSQPPSYGGNFPYGNNPYPNQGQQTQPYAVNPVYPDQQATIPGYSSYPQGQYPQQGNAYPNNQNAYPNQNTYPNQLPYSNQNPYHQQQGQPYPESSYPPNGQEQSYSTPYGNTEIPPAPTYPNQPETSPEYQSAQPQTTQPTSEPISLDVLLVKKHVVNGVQSYLPIKDGDILLDGRGNAQAGDKFRVMFRAKTDCYIYVIAVDGSAWAQGLFPSASSPFANPVKAGKQFVLPEGNNWFSLDQFKGIETIFVVASLARRQDIEQIMTTISGRERNPTDKPQSVSEPAIVPDGYAGARPSSSPFAFQTSQEGRQELLPTTYFVKTAGEDLRITRWFRHQ
ncbi:MAG: DUF4384 domain-containing protein [Nitrospirales bacterium]|nr:DUF4384 domain-containing protein [Nitrospirales bacterium]